MAHLLNCLIMVALLLTLWQLGCHTIDNKYEILGVKERIDRLEKDK